MRIAVTYENGEVFQHFGHSEQFKVYEVEDGKVVSSEVVGSDGQGHGALAGLLAGKGIDVLICGGIGGGAVNALTQAGITLCAGQSGSTDEVVEKYLKGELESTGANCDHHGEGHECGHHHDDDHECGCGDHDHGEGHECGCHGTPTLLFEGKNAGKKVRTHYTGTFNDGTVFDSSYERGEPLEFICAAGMMIPGFDKAVVDMEPGEKKDIHLMPAEAYGESNPDAIFTAPLQALPRADELQVGMRIYLQSPTGQPFPVTVTAKDDETITFDANHEMAGKELNFAIELVEVLD